MTLKEGQLVTYAIDEIIETVQNLTPMASKVTKYTPPAESMQRSSNTVWMPVEQEAPTQTGWDLTGNATGILELSVKCNMGDPDNDFFELRADDLRDERSYRRRIQASAKKLANNIESAIAKQATEMGSLVVHDTRAIGPSTGLSGWDFVSDAERLMFSRELNRDMGISYFLNPDDYRKAGRNLIDGDIFGRVTEDAYHNGTIQRQIAGFDEILRSPKLPAVTKSTATGVTVSGAQKFKPQAYTLDTDGNKENVDNLREELANPATDLDVTFDLLRQHRTAFRSNVQGDAMVFPNQAKAATNMVENAMSKDLRNAVAKNLGASDAAKYLKANSDYANVYNKVLNKNIANKLNKASSEASPELINTVVLSRKPSDVKRIWSALDDKGKDAMRAAYVSKIAEKAGDSPAKFITEVNKLKSQSGGEIYNTIFSGKHMKELDALHEVLQQTARSDTANVVTQTGQSQANRIRTIGATATLGVSMGLEAGFGAMMRLYESKAARNMLLRLANVKPGTPAYERALNQAANAVRPLLTNEATRQ